MNMHGHGLIKTLDALLVVSLCNIEGDSLVGLAECIVLTFQISVPRLRIVRAVTTFCGAHTHMPSTQASW